MRSAAQLTEHLVRSLFLLALAAAPLRGEEIPELSLGASGEVEAAPAGEERHVDTLEQKGGSIGYRGVASDGNGGRALPYGYLHSSAAGSLFYRRMDADTNIEVEGAFLNRNDFSGDLLLDYRGDYRLHLRTEGVYHNLDRELLFTPDFTFGTNPVFDPATGVPTPSPPTLYHAVQEPEEQYGVSVEQDLAQFRYRLHNFPLHLTLGYWRLMREGTVQQRYADTSFEGSGGGTTQNTVYAEPRRIDQRTEEVTAGLDTHLGWVDLIYAFKARQFEEHAGIPTQTYLPRLSLTGSTDFLGGVLQHNEEPDSRLYSHSVKLHTSLAGGVVATGSYSLEHRENLSRLTDTTGAKQASVDVQGGGADFAYTPCQWVTLALKYRHQELEHDGPSSVTNPFFTSAEPLRRGVDTVKDQVRGTVSYRLSRTATVTGEYRGDFLSRDPVSPLPTAGSYLLPEHSDTHRGSLAFLLRPRKGARLSARYSYATTDHPSYGASFGERHEGELLASYTSGNRWGVTAGVRERRDSNDEVRHPLITGFYPELSYALSPPVSRSKEARSGNLAVWSAPLERTTVSAYYSYLETEIDQGVFFTSTGTGSEAPSQYFSRAHVYGLNGTFAATRDLDLQLMLQQVRSHAAFAPDAASFPAGSVTVDTSGVRELSEVDSVISTFSARAEQRLGERLSASLEYTLNDYDEGSSRFSAYNGTVHTVAAYLSAKW